jgi:hypothetical protein
MSRGFFEELKINNWQDRRKAGKGFTPFQSYKAGNKKSG